MKRLYSAHGPARALQNDRGREREFLIDNLLVRIRVIIEKNRWTGLAPWEFEFLFSGSLISTSLA
jgi:hypothetical protein